MGDPADLTDRDRAALHEYAAKVVESVQSDESFPVFVLDGDCPEWEMLILMLSQEVVRLRAGRTISVAIKET